MPTIKDVARLAGVAPSSVTRVLAGHAYVRPELRERVLRAVEESGYAPDLVATALRRGRTLTVGVLVSDIVNPVLSTMVDVIEAELATAGYGVLLANSRGSSQRDVLGLAALRAHRVDGLIVSVHEEADVQIGAELRRFAGPLVLLDRQIEGLDVPAVLSDHYGGTRDLLRHLVDRGHREIAVVSGPNMSFPTRERLRALADVVAEHDLPVDPGYVVGGPATRDFGVMLAGRLLALPRPPTAIVVGNAAILVGVLHELASRGLVVGADIAVASGDDTYLSTLYTPALTAMHRDLGAVGAAASALLLDRIAEPTRPPEITRLPADLVVRVSTPYRKAV